MKAENRDITGRVMIENQDERKYLVGRWTPFDSPSVLMHTMRKKGNGYEVIRFREVIDKRAFDKMDWSDCLCVANHDENSGYIARYGVSLDISKGDDGMYYRAQLLESDPRAMTVMDYTQRGDYRGNSFAFIVDESTEKWERQADGTYLRTINDMSKVYHVGPVYRPAYPNTSVSVLSRSVDLLTTEEVIEQEIRDIEMSRKKRLLSISLTEKLIHSLK